MNLLKATEVLCYVCRGILIEPVTLPCSHVFCRVCLEQSLQETSHSCPLCRKRISNWIRSSKKSNKFVDVNLWEKIKEQFKEQVSLKLKGEDDGLDQLFQNEYKVDKPISKSGEMAQEFSKLLEDFKNEREKIKQAQELASKQLIEKLKAEEEERLQEIQEKNLMRLKEDEKLALIMQKEMEMGSLKNNSNEESTQKMTQKSTSRGPMDDFLKNLSNLNKRQSYRKSLSKETEDENEGVTSPDSTDSLRLEMNLFKPIKKVLRTPPKRYPDGRIREINLTKVTPLKLSFSNFIQSSTSDSNIIEGTKNIPSINSAFVDANSYQKYEEEEIDSSPKRLKLSTDESDIGILKDITLGENNDSNSVSTAQSDSTEKKSATKQIQENNNHHHHHHHHLPHHHLFPSLGKYHTGRKEDGENKSFQTQDYLNPSPTIEEKLIEEQRRIEQIILQEKKDRELALKLSQEWESETIRKPQTRSMITGAVKQRKTNLKTPKSQKTLFESAPIGTRSRRK